MLYFDINEKTLYYLADKAYNNQLCYEDIIDMMIEQFGYCLLYSNILELTELVYYDVIAIAEEWYFLNK